MEFNSMSIIFISLLASLSAFSTEAIRIPPSPSPVESEHVSPEEIPSLSLLKFSSSSSGSSTSMDPSLVKVCSVTENPARCVATLSPFLTSGDADPVSVLTMDIEVLYTQVEHAISIAKAMREKYSSVSSKVGTCLDACGDVYDRVIEDLARALTACSSRNIEMVDAMLNAAISNIGSCDEEFHKNGLRDSLMVDVDRMLIEIAGYGLDISRKLIQKLD